MYGVSLPGKYNNLDYMREERLQILASIIFLDHKGNFSLLFGIRDRSVRATNSTMRHWSERIFGLFYDTYFPFLSLGALGSESEAFT